ncbi:stathmin isoform X2 [Lycorma delicatula]|uniref:stathmin isoform X2 n=1 Tax=Lycorma delicatula TaxID=130591 RepID=UPI003F50DCC3
MVLGLFTDSVLQCFCRSCQAPLPFAANRRHMPANKTSAPLKKPKTKPKTKQPKKVKFIATEIRCQEEAKGGLKYDVILADSTGTPPAKRSQSPTRTKSVENIEEKLKAAQERRLSLEANKMATLAAKLSKIEEASKKKDEQNSVFITQTKEALEQKMENHIEKREAYITDIRTKLKDHLEGVEKTRQILEQQTLEVRTAVEEKLKSAAAQRDENTKKMLVRLKEHERRAEMVRLNKEKLANQNEEQETASSG